MAEAERGAVSAAFLDAAPTSAVPLRVECRWLWRCLCRTVRERRLIQAPPAVLKELEVVRSLTETSSASPPGLDTAFGVRVRRRGVSEGLEIV